ncbi:MAG: hypothetical protein SGPRY_008416, partial [Prymnesium sp.]
ALAQLPLKFINLAQIASERLEELGDLLACNSRGPPLPQPAAPLPPRLGEEENVRGEVHACVVQEERASGIAIHRKREKRANKRRGQADGPGLAEQSHSAPTLRRSKRHRTETRAHSIRGAQTSQIPLHLKADPLLPAQHGCADSEVSVQCRQSSSSPAPAVDAPKTAPQTHSPCERRLLQANDRIEVPSAPPDSGTTATRGRCARLPLQPPLAALLDLPSHPNGGRLLTGFLWEQVKLLDDESQAAEDEQPVHVPAIGPVLSDDSELSRCEVTDLFEAATKQLARLSSPPASPRVLHEEAEKEYPARSGDRDTASNYDE